MLKSIFVITSKNRKILLRGASHAVKTSKFVLHLQPIGLVNFLGERTATPNKHFWEPAFCTRDHCLRAGVKTGVSCALMITCLGDVFFL